MDSKWDKHFCNPVQKPWKSPKSDLAKFPSYSTNSSNLHALYQNCNMNRIFRVEYLLLPGNTQTMIAAYITENNITVHPMKLFLNGAQVVSRGYKEGLKSVFKGVPFVSKATSNQTGPVSLPDTKGFIFYAG